MIRTDREALTCDLAECYRIYDMRDFPAYYIATLAAGLGEDSRIMKEMLGKKADTSTHLQAMTVDLLQYLLWTRTKDAQHGRNRPESITDKLTQAGEKDNAVVTADQFDRIRSGMLNG